ncbi:prolactin-7A1-like [Arvicola amphibius]|uniref:prolactin-7A1-like n=1 Tax=Arvicola amphibius TaxID=1047088 RepID=UPI0018E33164|nr:prolactin-7A1-like [Arvicola amphibius]
MPLSFSRPCSWALLVLLVSNFLLWENVASAPLNSNETDDLHLKELFDHAMLLCQSISDLNMDLPRIFTVSASSAKVSNKFVSTSLTSIFFPLSLRMLEFLRNQEFLVKNLISCHNYSIKTPEDMDEVQMISLEDFPKLILSRMQAWNDTLHNLLIILGSMPGSHNDVLFLAKDIRTKTAELFEDTKGILSKIYGTTENVDYTLWSGLEDIQSSDEDSRFIALCQLSYCLHMDLQTVDLSLMILRCMVLVDSDICSSTRNGDS